ncbi:ABC transporter ATP-binding protein [Skermanella pratensis]|uniref:ABC transporter ATP-binding protein n=1 Tax=Skermanella pratensis TaxID=2233999 RepID=UPI0013011A77|nr:ABC transporter ATP-binding protein [Skermanella pratensis]
MSGLVLEGISKRFNGVAAVDHVDLAVPNGTFVCMLGPSGCGKTTLLRTIAGLEEPSSGRILIDGKDMTRVPAHRRDFGMVFQSLALFPHLDAGGNVAYPLRIRGVGRAEQARRVEELLALVDLRGYAGRPVAQLSGGQRQRVAIARALALSPKLFLLDEPLSALDAKLRETMQVELRKLQQRLGITTIVVTHDQREAMTMADLVVVMGQGRIQQAASPVEIYRRPVNSFVADFIGSTNLIAVRAAGQGIGEGVEAPGGTIPGVSLAPGQAEATLSVRPEDIHLVPAGEAPLTGRISFIRDLGASIETFVDAGGTQIVAVASPRERAHFQVGDTVGLRLDPETCRVLAS